MGKNIPLRKCLGCGEMLGKKGMIRIVRDKDGAVFIDETGKRSGRGAYICRDAQCLAAAQKKRAIERALKCGVPPEICEQLARIAADGAT